MIYRMIMGDLLRFVTIYVVFVMGFSQGERKQENSLTIRSLLDRMESVTLSHSAIFKKIHRFVFPSMQHTTSFS